MLNLFINLLKGDTFHFGDTPERTCIKYDDHHYVSQTGVHLINEHVAVVPNDHSAAQSIYDSEEVFYT